MLGQTLAIGTRLLGRQIHDQHGADARRARGFRERLEPKPENRIVIGEKDERRLRMPRVHLRDEL